MQGLQTHPHTSITGGENVVSVTFKWPFHRTSAPLKPIAVGFVWVLLDLAMRS